MSTRSFEPALANSCVCCIFVAIMNQWVNEIEKAKKYSIVYTPPAALRREINDIAVQRLGVPDLNKVRDKFEGAAYLQRLTEKVYALKALEYALGRELVQWEEIRMCPDKLFSRDAISNAQLELVVCSYESYPKIVNEFIYPIVCVLIRDKTCYVMGYLYEEEFQKEHNFIEAKKFGTVDKTSKLLARLSCLVPLGQQNF